MFFATLLKEQEKRQNMEENTKRINGTQTEGKERQEQ